MLYSILSYLRQYDVLLCSILWCPFSECDQSVSSTCSLILLCLNVSCEWNTKLYHSINVSAFTDVCSGKCSSCKSDSRSHIITYTGMLSYCYIIKSALWWYFHLLHNSIDQHFLAIEFSLTYVDRFFSNWKWMLKDGCL